MGDDGGGSLVGLDGVAPICIVDVSASVIFPCTIQSRFLLLALAYLGSQGRRAVKQFVCVCVCVCVCVFQVSPGHLRLLSVSSSTCRRRESLC